MVILVVLSFFLFLQKFFADTFEREDLNDEGSQRHFQYPIDYDHRLTIS